MTYEESLEFIHSFINYEKTDSLDYPEAFKLDRMRALAKEVGNPQNAFLSLIVAGSKGKGSTCAILSSILRMDDYRVGLYTSPHLDSERERIQVNGLLISEIRFTEMAAKLEKILDEYSWRKDPPTYFEILTVMAFWHFKEMKVQVAVLEVGLGGLFDSTNIAEAKVAGLAPISLEHTDKLGKTLSKIAVQKCGIIKGREIVISAPQAEDAEKVIVKAAEEKEAELFRVNKEIKIFERDYGSDYQRFDVKSPLGDFYNLKLKLLGRHQIDNAATAIGMAKAFEKKTRFKISDIAVQKGILDARWPGRLEKVMESPLIVLDGAQNPESAKRLMEALKRHFHYERLIVVLGVSKDKDIKGILSEFLPESPLVVATQAGTPRAREAKSIGEYMSDMKNEAIVIENPAEAIQKARILANKEDLILITGSLFLVADARRILKG